MSDDARVGSTPLSFKAGGRGRRPPPGGEAGGGSNAVEAPRRTPRPPSPSRPGGRPPSSGSSALAIVRTGLAGKRSPLRIENWIACVLTLDGRDKFTKVLQYSSRLLTWYFAGLAKRAAGGGVGGASNAASSIASFNLLAAVATDLPLRQQLYSALSQRFSALYKSLVTSRKAFRLGRSVIEWNKLKSMGWGDYLRYMLMHPLAGGVADAAEERDKGQKSLETNGGMGTTASHTLDRYDTHPIPEEEGSQDGEDEHDDESSWDGECTDEDDDGGLPSEEKKLDPSPKEVKVASRPGRPKLPSRISSNVGWGPPTTTTSAKYSITDDATSNPSSPANPPPARTVSEMGRRMYRPFPSRSSSMGSYRQLKETTVETPSTASPSTATPSWKLVGGTVKLLGLMGFWAFDNLAFLTGSGFLDPIRLRPPSSFDAAANAKQSPGESRMMRKKGYSEWAARCYFFGVVAGLYVNARALWGHRNGVLRDARDRLDCALRRSNSPATSFNGEVDNDDGDGNVKEALAHLERTKQKHFELALALLKSCCDFAVFSNNPGIDLHLKLRGRKNHEGLHCLGGLVSAGTVLYNNFPNAK